LETKVSMNKVIVAFSILYPSSDSPCDTYTWDEIRMLMAHIQCRTYSKKFRSYKILFNGAHLFSSLQFFAYNGLRSKMQFFH